ncbi:unnamed protein product [Adineta ricciae]|uniref:Tetratricopeptide repeat protein 6 n=1 Tax=Adineta ricciae TaxID=249248 RepID=A0A816A5T5_ADIRI|nr:unnamed protein product [Adineta ricciae]CAF1593728.1 unnamed protein product [Adineta ricciae]
MVDLPSVKQSYIMTTTSDLKARPIKSTLGVLPMRQSESIPELNLVHLRGRSVMPLDMFDDEFTSNRVAANTPITPRRQLPTSETNPMSAGERYERLPAILPMVGTTHTAVLQERQPLVKPVIHRPVLKKRKVDVVVVESDVNERNTPRSVINRMVREAQLLTQPTGSDRVRSQSRLSDKPQSLVTTTSGTSTQQQSSTVVSEDPTRMAVENLIASIKSKQLQEAQRQSDRKIVDIIHRVLGRTVDLVYDEDEYERIEQQDVAREDSEIGRSTDVGAEEEEMDEEDATIVSRAADGIRSNDQVELDQNQRDKDEQEEDEDVQDEDIDERDRTIGTSEFVDEDEEIDITRDPLYYHTLLEVTNEDILNVRGTQINVPSTLVKKNQRRATKPLESTGPNVHHFCIQMVDEADVLPKEIRAITQLYHTRARFRHQLPFSTTYHKHGELPNYPPKEINEEEERKEKSKVLQRVRSGVPSIPFDNLESLDTDLNVWQNRAAKLVQPKVEGTSAITQDPYLIRLWAPAPPKMYIHPRRVRERLFPQYSSSAHSKGLSDDDDDVEEKTSANTSELARMITTFSERETSIEEQIVPPIIRSYKSLERLPSTIDSNEEFQMLPRMIRSTRSCSNLTAEPSVSFDTDYIFTLNETKHQTEARKVVKTEAVAVAPLPNKEVLVLTPEPAEITNIKATPEPAVDQSAETSSTDFKYFRKTNRSAHYEQALAAGRPYISSGHLRATRRSRKDAQYWERIDAIAALASAPPRYPILSRRESFHEAFFYERNHPHVVKQQFRQRNTSLEHGKQTFDGIIKTKYDYGKTRVKSAGKRQLSEFEWTRDLWYTWLDEYIAELDKQEFKRQETDTKKQSTSPPANGSLVATAYDDDDDEEGTSRRGTGTHGEPIVNLELADSEERRLIENEIHRLTALINRDPRDVFSLSRRGALFRKLGLFHDALNDLSLAIYIEPSFMDAYWQRALIYIIFEHYDEALDSLNMCIKFNKTHAGAYKLRADVHAIKGDLALANANYSQAIRYNPTDHESYFRRAQTYERRNEILLAMDDYVQVTRLNPKNIEAWYKHAMYYYNSANYDNAIGDFNELLKRQPDHVSARLHRALSNFYLEEYQYALNDFSATLHYDPSNWMAYYYRGLLLRACNPHQALRDFSISLLLNPEYDNVGAYLHRALLYCKENQFEEAIADYEAVIVLDREHAPALCNLAIIYMRKNAQKAIQLFTRSIQADPTYVRAYFCRAYFYSQLNQYQQAYSDYTKIYHMFPDQNSSVVLRGNMLLQMGQLDLASFCVEVAASLQSLSGSEEDSLPSAMKMNASSPQQQAIVHAFLEHYDRALSIMEYECSLSPTPVNWRMLGGLRVKAKRFDEAREAYEKCIQACLNNVADQKGELHGVYLDLSKCLIQLKRYSQAVDQLTALLKLQYPNQSAEAYLQRGIAKMRMFAHYSPQELAKLSSSRRPLLDINKALVIEPNNAEAYLARAAWYGRCERYSKGVLNCNEAIRLCPNLVRAYLYRGCLKYSIRLYDHAINDLTKALQIDPSCSHGYYNRALCYIRRGNLSHALKDFAIVLCLASSIRSSKTQLLELETYVNRGLLHYDHKDFQNALVDFEHALNLVLESGEDKKIYTLKHRLIYTIGQCHHRLAQFDKAIAQFTSSEIADRFTTDASYRHDVWIALGNVYMDMPDEKSRAKATKLFERVIHENPLQEHARLNLGYSLRQRAYYQRAWLQFSALLRINPRHVRALEARAIVCLQMNHPREAFIDLNQALHFEPSSAQLLTNRGVIQQFLGDNRSAMCDYRAAMLADPQNAFAHYNAGNILMFHGQFLQAIGLFDRVLEINPRDEAALTNRAIAKIVLKQYTSARQDLEQALSISPLSAHIHVDLGQLLLTMDEPAVAEEHFTQALYIRPCDPAVLKWRGDARSKQEGKHKEALEDYRACVELNDALQLARKHGLIKVPKKTKRRL